MNENTATSERDSIIAEIEEKLSRINGKSKLEKLQSYYFTWRLPKHPRDETLFRIVHELSKIKNLASDQVISRLHNGQNIEVPFELDTIAGIFDLEPKSEWDRNILEHCKRHYFVLQLIREELAV